MNNIKNYLKKGALLMSLFMFFIIPNMNVYSSVGNYATWSTSLDANNSRILNIENSQSVAWWVVAAEAIALAYASGYALGTVAHHAWNAIGPQQETLAFNSIDYNPNDFSKFDN